MKLRTWTMLTALPVLALAACGPKAEQAASNASNTVENAIADAGNATSNVLENAGQALTPTPSGQEFADKAAKSDAFEIAAAKLAATNAASAGVKDFAKMMIDAHGTSTAKVKKAAGEAVPAIVPDATLTAEQQGKLTDLGKLTGADFDKAYVKGQVEAHEDALALMKKYAADGTVASLKTAAGDIAPVVDTHLTKAKALEEVVEKK